METTSSCSVLSAKRHRTMTSGWQGAPYFRRYVRELVSKPAISLKKNWRGYRRTSSAVLEVVDSRSCCASPKKLFIFNYFEQKLFIFNYVEQNLLIFNHFEQPESAFVVVMAKSVAQVYKTIILQNKNDKNSINGIQTISDKDGLRIIVVHRISCPKRATTTTATTTATTTTTTATTTTTTVVRQTVGQYSSL